MNSDEVCHGSDGNAWNSQLIYSLALSERRTLIQTSNDHKDQTYNEEDIIMSCMSDH